jgi:hypothetical protein
VTASCQKNGGAPARSLPAGGSSWAGLKVMELIGRADYGLRLTLLTVLDWLWPLPETETDRAIRDRTGGCARRFHGSTNGAGDEFPRLDVWCAADLLTRKHGENAEIEAGSPAGSDAGTSATVSLGRYRGRSGLRSSRFSRHRLASIPLEESHAPLLTVASVHSGRNSHNPSALQIHPQ